MSTIPYERPIKMEQNSDGTRKALVTWRHLANGDDGEAVELDYLPDRSVHVFGTWGAGGQLLVKGSNESGASTNFSTLRDSSHALLSFMADDIQQVLENTTQVRPTVPAGDATTDLTVVVKFFHK